MQPRKGPQSEMYKRPVVMAVTGVRVRRFESYECNCNSQAGINAIAIAIVIVFQRRGVRASQGLPSWAVDHLLFCS